MYASKDRLFKLAYDRLIKKSCQQDHLNDMMKDKEY